MSTYKDTQTPASGPREPRNDIRRLHLVFTGEVQGVGFRWTAQHVAHDVRVTGWVRNEGDGSVTMEIQGSDLQISEFFGRFNRSYAYYPIDYVIDDKHEIGLVPDEHDFRVRF